MANVLFTRKNASEIPNVPITDGQLIFDTSGNGKMYLDNGTNRLEMGGAVTVDATLSKTSTNPVQNKAVAGVMLDTLSDIGNVTSKGFLTDALAVKELNTNVNELNNSIDSISIKHKEVYHNVVNVDTNTTEITFEVPSDCKVPLFCVITKAWARQAWTNGACVTIAQDSFSMSGTGNIRLTTNYSQKYEIVIIAFYL